MADERAEKVDAMLSKVIADIPQELLEQAQSMSEADLLEQALERALRHLMLVLHLYEQARSRCGVCESAGRQCGHCFAENERIEGLVREAMALALMVKVATGPGTRFAAERERREEQERLSK